jgi:hypothetical protein
VEAARTRFLALVTATGGLAQARTDAAADTALGLLGAYGGIQRLVFNTRPRDSFEFRAGD